MARVDKYFGTNIFISGKEIERLRELGYAGTHGQFRVVCKAKSRAEANRIAITYGIGEVFSPRYTSETGNRTELEECDKNTFIICINGTMGNDYVGIEKIIK